MAASAAMAGPGSARTSTSACWPVRSLIDTMPPIAWSRSSGRVRGSFRVNPPSLTARVCGASCWITFGASGMNQASLTAVSSAPTTESVPSGAIRACHGDGRGTERAWAANRGASADGAALPAGRSRTNVPSSGTQMSLQTSQVASALIRIGPAAPVMVTGSRTSPA